MTDYKLKCVKCGEEYTDSSQGFLLECANSSQHGPSMLRAEYSCKSFSPDTSIDGIYRYHEWLPIRRVYKRSPKTIIFQNAKLSRDLGLPNLFFAFNGYWPERNGGMPTCAFKELEAASVMARIPDGEKRSIVVASAGNTGRAFLEYGSLYKVNTTVVVPEFALPQMWTTVPKADCVKLFVLKDADYFAAIQLADKICLDKESYFAEGGAKNIARRDGMGTVMLAATEAIGKLPNHYFQAVGSGTGAIAAWEMAQRLIADGRFGSKLPKLHLSQTEAFTIMADAWNSNSRALPSMPDDIATAKAKQAYSPVLSNRKPPYSLCGGLFDAMTDSTGAFYVPSNNEAIAASKLFTELENIDLDKAAQICFASFMKAANNGAFDKNETILVNLTGGGAERAKKDGIVIQAEPDRIF